MRSQAFSLFPNYPTSILHSAQANSPLARAQTNTASNAFSTGKQNDLMPISAESELRTQQDLNISNSSHFAPNVFESL